MYDITDTATGSLRTAVLVAINAVPETVRTHALGLVTAYTNQADRSAADPNSGNDGVHLERAAYWACTARERGASEQQIADAEKQGHCTAHRAV